MNRRQKIIVSITGIFIVLLALIGLTYAYFLTKITPNSNQTSISVTTADLKLIYDDGTDGVIGGTNIIPSNREYTKTFSVRNEGNTTIEYGVFLINVINTFIRKDDIKYTMSCTTDGTLSCGEVSSETTFPSGIKELVTSIIEAGKTHTYTFKFTYKDSGTDQSIDMGKELSAKLQIFTKLNDGTYFPYEEGTLAYNVINNVTNGELAGKTTFTANLSSTGMVNNPTTANDKILSTATDDYGTTYYFRGNPIDNYVEFAGMCWRIVRIQGDGSTKLILASENNCSESNLTHDSGFISRELTGDLEYLQQHYGGQTRAPELVEYGFKQIGSGRDRELFFGYHYSNPDDNESVGNSAKYELNKWLGERISSAEQAKLKTEQYCIGDLTNAYLIDEDTGEIIGTTTVEQGFTDDVDFEFIAGKRIYNDATPSYICEISGKAEEFDINKIGMLTIDEVVYAGAAWENSVHYLNDNAEKWDDWWTLSPSDHTSSTAYKIPYIFILDKTGQINVDLPNDNNNQVRPVVTLKANVLSAGNGTITNPYRIG